MCVCVCVCVCVKVYNYADALHACVYIIMCLRTYIHIHTHMHTHLFHVDVKGTTGLALGTVSRLHLVLQALDKRPQDVTALEAVVLDDAQLREDARGAVHHARGPYELV